MQPDKAADDDSAGQIPAPCFQVRQVCYVMDYDAPRRRALSSLESPCALKAV
jgi:hypothetical protein